MCCVQTSPLLQLSQWATHLEDAVQFGQTRGLFLLPAGRPLLLGAGGSGGGSVGGASLIRRRGPQQAAVHVVLVPKSQEFA